MRSLLVEFHRFNDLDSGSWRTSDSYLVAAADHRVREFKMPIGQDDFLDLVLDLRYQKTADARIAALNKVGEIATQFLGTASLEDMKSGRFPLQLDLVVNPAELAALPFEAATDGEGRPLFARGEQAVILTRRVRHEFADASPRWPARPRILYVWAAPPGVGDVPSAEHESALRSALGPWIDPDDDPQYDRVLKTLGEATLPALAQTCRTAVDEKRPFTHVHVLAHGYPIGHAHRQRFGMALHSADGDLEEVTPEQVEEALKPLVGHAVVVTLATCDSGNLANTTTSQRSIAHNLHVLGFPIVVASQLPLTKAGSTRFVKRFYPALLGGKDVRLALHEARVALYQNQKETGHDWASLMGYAQLPEGYADHLLDIRLESVLAALKTIQGRSAWLVARGETNPERFDPVVQLLQARISGLEAFLNELEKTGRRGVLEENSGLLGSAEMRLAELCFVRSALNEMEKWRGTMREALERALGWYRRAFEGNLSHYWTGVQYLSLDAVLSGTIREPSRWHVAVEAAEIDRQKSYVWALSSQAELYLLASRAGQEARSDFVCEILQQLKYKARSNRDPFPLEAMERQLRRYTDWWTTENGFFAGGPDLSLDVRRFLNVLRQ